ncbi:pyridoxamine 5'-phosphate oxidase family protein [Ligilactobacillus sp. WILCCON 0076]|uniref:Pyridoxamine 5'-phosphate oxidase family protein n=1 Tax=Ligilactobacillus ubinensis TaxID=2876789 RepID=A0A9X2JKX8_9LACO|nr:pyridoxamine 5'-phosphate oxidase family protein [Ligilactobacillus ubinensis]MCP0886527.1 pyridoxamine 5'-phosphate oxidase family protein [Ligilactobacillus ubinensis]
MYTKRFIQLFIMFLLTIFFSMSFVYYFNIKGYLAQSLILSFVGYIILVIPLTILTLLKQRKKFSHGTKSGESDNVFQNSLKILDNIITLSTTSLDNVSSTSIITFKQSNSDENIFYCVTKKETVRVKNIQSNNAVSITTWFDDKTGSRISSNSVNAIIIEGQAINNETIQHPEIKTLSDDFSNNVIIKLTIRSVLVESFQSSPVVVDFT